MGKQREFSPMHCESPDANEIFCRDCSFRDKTTIDLGDGEIPVGVTKAYCDIYIEPNSKPNKILFQQAPCDFYVKDEGVR